MNRPYMYRTWNELMKARDALQLLCDLGFYDEADCEALVNINDEIHYRYEHGSTKGGDLFQTLTARVESDRGMSRVITQEDRDDHSAGDGD